MAELEAKITARLVDEATGKATKIASSLAAIEKASGGATAAAARLTELAAAEAEAEAAARRAAEAQRMLAKEAGVSVADVRGLSSAAREAAASEQELAEAAERAARARAATGAADAQAAQQSAAAAAAVDAGAEQTRRGFGKVSDASKAQGRAMAEQVNFLTEVGLGFGMLSPATQQASIAFASAGNNAFALANALGPIGPMIALAIGAATAAAGAWAKWGGATRDAAKAAREARQAFLDQVDAAQQVADLERRERELRRGDRSVEEQQAALTTAEKTAREATGRREALTTRELGEDSFLARAAGAIGGRGLRAAVGQATGSDVVDFYESLSLVAPMRTGLARNLQTGAIGDSRDAERERAQLDVALGRARERESAEQRREALQGQVSGAEALRASFEADVRRRFGTSERGRRQADQLLSSLDVARLDDSDRVVLDAQGSRAARGLSSDDRSAVLGRAQELLQAQRRAAAAEEALRQPDIVRARAANVTERGADPTARPDVALRDQGGELAALLTRYIAAEQGDPQALPRALEQLARATASLEATAREGTNVRVTQVAPPGGRVSGLSGMSTTGR